MTSDCIQDRARIIPGSKADFTIYLVDEAGRPVSLSPYTSGNLVFCNCEGVRTVIALTVPGSNPDKGQLDVTVTAVQSADADKKWVNADVELSDGVDTLVVPLNNKFEIIPRNCPPIV